MIAMKILERNGHQHPEKVGDTVTLADKPQTLEELLAD